MPAASSAVTPKVDQPSSTTTAREVRFTDSTMGGQSIGRMERRSITSASMSSSSSCLAASLASTAMRDTPMIVTSEPRRRVAAMPIGVV